MNQYISSREALDALAASAPRAWCKRLLVSFVMDGTVKAYARGGHLVGRVPSLCLLDNEDIAPGDEDRFWAAVREKWGIIAPKPEQVFDGHKYPVTGYRWYDDAPMQIHPFGYGYFAYADTLDWEIGSLTVQSLFPDEADRDLFLPDDVIFSDTGNLAQPLFSWLEFEVSLTGISFESSVIELLSAVERIRPRTIERAGRPTKWDWIGAMASVVALANRPDGIGTERGEQTKVENAICNWFMRETGDQPHISQIRSCAQRIMAELAEKSDGGFSA